MQTNFEMMQSNKEIRLSSLPMLQFIENKIKSFTQSSLFVSFSNHATFPALAGLWLSLNLIENQTALSVAHE